MVQHIVLFRLTDDCAPTQRQAAMQAFKEAIEALPAAISCIVSVRVDFNINPQEAWHVCLQSAFHTLSDVATYSAHPAHQAAAALLKPYIAARACTDITVG